MDATTITIIVIAIIAIGMAIVLPIIYKKYATNYDAIFKTMELILNLTQTITSQLNFNKKELVQLIVSVAKQSVEYAEQLYKSGQITKTERKNTAVAYVNNMLDMMEIEVKNKQLLDSIIEDTIEAAVLTLPPTDSDEA